MKSLKKAQFGTTTDPVKKPTWQQMTQAQKAAKKTELIAKGGFEMFKKYKDSISAEATNRREAEINKAASNKGMTRAEYEKWYKNQSKKPDVPSTDQSGVKGANKRTRDRGTCNTKTTIPGESLRDFKRGGVLKKTGKLIPKKSSVSKKLGSAKKTIGNMIFKSKKK
jgi:hypothetical protein